jgi:hypothetical protein
MSNYKPLYKDTDSAYIMNDAISTKQYLNSLYGTKGVIFMNREYISVIVDDNPTVIFKRNIIAVAKENSFTSIKCIGGYDFLTKEDYASVVKKIIG